MFKLNKLKKKILVEDNILKAYKNKVLNILLKYWTDTQIIVDKTFQGNC